MQTGTPTADFTVKLWPYFLEPGWHLMLQLWRIFWLRCWMKSLSRGELPLGLLVIFKITSEVSKHYNATGIIMKSSPADARTLPKRCSAHGSVYSTIFLPPVYLSRESWTVITVAMFTAPQSTSCPDNFQTVHCLFSPLFSPLDEKGKLSTQN